jgi:hypothetical protein
MHEQVEYILIHSIPFEAFMDRRLAEEGSLDLTAFAVALTTWCSILELPPHCWLGAWEEQEEKTEKRRVEKRGIVQGN